MPQDPFDILGLPARFTLDAAALQRAYLFRSASVHPDLADSPEALDQAAALNQARQRLEDPESRADALLARLGGPSRESDRALPDGFLIEIMGVREELEQAIASGDQEGMDRLAVWAEERRVAHMRAAGERFDALSDLPEGAALKAIRRDLNAWRYIERMLEQVNVPKR